MERLYHPNPFGSSLLLSYRPKLCCQVKDEYVNIMQALHTQQPNPAIYPADYLLLPAI